MSLDLDRHVASSIESQDPSWINFLSRLYLQASVGDDLSPELVRDPIYLQAYRLFNFVNSEGKGSLEVRYNKLAEHLKGLDEGDRSFALLDQLSREDFSPKGVTLGILLNTYRDRQSESQGSEANTSNVASYENSILERGIRRHTHSSADYALTRVSEPMGWMVEVHEQLEGEQAQLPELVTERYHSYLKELLDRKTTEYTNYDTDYALAQVSETVDRMQGIQTRLYGKHAQLPEAVTEGYQQHLIQLLERKIAELTNYHADYALAQVSETVTRMIQVYQKLHGEDSQLPDEVVRLFEEWRDSHSARLSVQPI